MKTKHTPGPWEIFYGETNRAHSIEHVTETGILQLVAKIPAHTRNDKANAKLFAAAPDLLEACQSVMSCERGKHLPADVVVKLGNAILKATS